MCKNISNALFQKDYLLDLEMICGYPSAIDAINFFCCFSESRDETLTIGGYIQLPSKSVIKENSCLKIAVTDAILCSLGQVGCDRKVYYEEKRNNFEKSRDRIRYRIDVKVDSEILFEISAIITNGWCGDAIRKGDFLNDEGHSFERRGGNTDIRKDITLIQYGDTANEKTESNFFEILSDIFFPDRLIETSKMIMSAENDMNV